jgi:hypothetical protein
MDLLRKVGLAAKKQGEITALTTATKEMGGTPDQVAAAKALAEKVDVTQASSQASSGVKSVITFFSNGFFRSNRNNFSNWKISFCQNFQHFRTYQTCGANNCYFHNV